MKHITKCVMCGKQIINTGVGQPKKYCSEKCKEKGTAIVKAKQNKAKREKRRAEKKMKQLKCHLDETLAECRAKGITYAERQKAETLKLARSGKL